MWLAEKLDWKGLSTLSVNLNAASSVDMPFLKVYCSGTSVLFARNAGLTYCTLHMYMLHVCDILSVFNLSAPDFYI
jgi:hypothetical protein